ncbi:Eco57I restriction-modification methylase domain-containing protein [Catenibacterium sp. UBA627]|uniref:Eco57I restriction-modification methylase domain-containing protein n=1 Tax=Catenibacterium sp. UBA627 TaxID=1946309 RepID=UPI00257E75C3|nr:Eco57I restriction-modification methylase domain-containing protein [Catenibacterium sp. UBA627]
MSKKLFDFAIGNPPYQELSENTSDKPVYDKFMDAAYSVSDKTELITPARFLFNAGKTPKMWNDKMLHDQHFKVMHYEEDAAVIFPNTDIKGGVAITYRDTEKEFGAIEVFTNNSCKNTLLHKVIKSKDFKPVGDIVYAPESYKFTGLMYKEHPEIKTSTIFLKGKEVPLISKGHDYDVTSNIFEKLNGIVFFDSKPNDEDDYIQMVGRKNNKRCSMWIKRKYIAEHPNLDRYKILFSKANGSGKYGETIALPIISKPGEGHTQTFISIGSFCTKEEAEAEYKYVQTKFARALLGILKVTQDNKKSVWKYVPIQDFSDKSDIDWSKSIKDIDLQLYRKYGLSAEEVAFIETNVKEME